MSIAKKIANADHRDADIAPRVKRGSAVAKTHARKRNRAAIREEKRRAVKESGEG